jgi:tetratricopeptide (TPR) repeat protein
MARSAHREAVGFFEQALSALPHLPETRDTREQAIDLRFALSQALFPLLEFSQSLAYLREAEPLAEALGDQRRLGWLSASMSYCFWVMGDMEHAIAVGQRAHAIAETLEDSALQFETHVHLGRTYRILGDYRRGIEVLRRNVAAINGASSRARFGMPDPSRAVTSHAWLAVCHTALGEFAEAIAIGEEAVRMAETVDQPLSRIVAAWGVGGVALAQGDVPTAISVLACGLEVCQHWDIHAYAPAIASALGASYTLSRRVDEALPLLEQYAFQGTVVQQSVAVPRLSEAYLLAGRVEDAMRLAQHALEICHAYRYRGSEAWALRLLGEIHARHDPPQVAQAEAHYQQALALAEELGMRPLQAHCHLGLGRLYGSAGRGAQARAALSAAIELYHAMAMTFWLPQVEAALAQVKEE